MKAKMRVKYRKEAFSVLGCILLWAVLFGLAYASGDVGIAIICLLMGLVILFAMICKFSYGIRIGKKRVFAMEQNCVRLLKYDKVKRIEVTFANECIFATITETNNAKHEFLWDDIYLGSIFPRWNRIRITKKFVEKSIESLSKCEKVRITNRFEEE